MVLKKLARQLWITTECGRLQVSPGEVVVLTQGFRFVVNLLDGPLRGYVAEIFGTHFQLPDLGPIGSNGLVGPRDFLVPTAWFEERICSGFTIIQKFGGELFTTKQDFSSFNVVAWHGNYVPYKYDLAKFCPYNTFLIDHGDPSINTGIFLHSADRFNEDSEHTDITNDKSKTTPLLDENTTAMVEP
ncbi:hypothetical protein AgCh_032372 [Apium graveolens]